jgi:hypothetical protein
MSHAPSKDVSTFFASATGAAGDKFLQQIQALRK